MSDVGQVERPGATPLPLAPRDAALLACLQAAPGLQGLLLNDPHFADQASLEMLQPLIIESRHPPRALAWRPAAAGSPVHALEVALAEATMLVQARVDRGTDELAQGGRLSQPLSVGQLMQRRVAQLAPPTPALARVANIAGVDFSKTAAGASARPSERAGLAGGNCVAAWGDKASPTTPLPGASTDGAAMGLCLRTPVLAVLPPSSRHAAIVRSTNRRRNGMTDFKGKHVWFELNTTDLQAAESFYASVAGWVPRDAGMPNMQYTMIGPADHAVGGMMVLTEEMKAGGACPGWTGYVAVDDVDAAAAHTTNLGGQVFVPPQDIPGVGRFSIVCDPQGAVLSLFKGTPSEGMEPPPPPAPGTPGHIGWHELHTTSLDGALTFYGQLFGWRKGETMDMGPNGVYQLFATGAQGDNADGGMVLKQPAAPRPYWLYYINVASVDESLARITAGGGHVQMGPHQVPGGSWIVLGTDPQGAAFAVVGAR